MKVYGFVPAKGSSSRLENKNNLEIFGEPLYVNALNTLLKCEQIHSVFLDTESDQFISYVKENIINVNIMRRDSRLANNQTDGNLLLLNEAKHYPADIYVEYLCTSPFISPITIDKGIKILIENPQYDSVVAVRKEKMYLWSDEGPLYDQFNIPNSNTLPDTIVETMGLYIIRGEALHRLKRRVGDSPYLLELSSVEAIDINYPDDYLFAKIIEKGLNAHA
jgi:CMP-N-acetylneuraminic acid synthetase